MIDERLKPRVDSAVETALYGRTPEGTAYDVKLQWAAWFLFVALRVLDTTAGVSAEDLLALCRERRELERRRI